MFKRPSIGLMVIAFLVFCFAPLAAWAEERCVLVELFTSVDCEHCPKAEGALDSLTQEYPDDSLAIIRYHSEGALYQPSSSSRKSYYDYPFFIYPTTLFDGVITVKGAVSEDSAYVTYKGHIESRLAIASPLSMDLSVAYDTLSRSGQASVQVIAVDSVEADTLHLRYALIESGLVHDDDIYQEVLRDMVPDAAGVSFSFAQVDTFRDTVDFSLDSLWLPEKCDLVAFVQDDASKEVLQSIQTWIPLPQVPAAVEDLEITLAGPSLFLAWSPVTKDKYGHPLEVDYYRVFKDTSLYLAHGTKVLLDSTQELFYLDSSCSHIGDPQVNYSYYVTAVIGGLESGPSRVVGEFDRFLKQVK